jgi:hypothetical protein
MGPSRWTCPARPPRPGAVRGRAPSADSRIIKALNLAWGEAERDAIEGLLQSDPGISCRQAARRPGLHPSAATGPGAAGYSHRYG